MAVNMETGMKSPNRPNGGELNPDFVQKAANWMAARGNGDTGVAVTNEQVVGGGPGKQEVVFRNDGVATS